MLIELIGRGFSNRFFRRLFMLIDFSLFRRCGPGRNDADRFFLAHHMHNKEQSRALGVSNCSFSCFVLGGCVHQAEERVEEDLAGFLEIYIVLAQIDGCLLGVPYKGLPAQLKPSVRELQCIYIACTRQVAYLFVCATGTCDGADIGGLGSAVSAARLHRRRVEGAPRQKYVLLSSRGHFPMCP